MFLNEVLLESICLYENEVQAIRRVQNIMTTIRQNNPYSYKASRGLIKMHGVEFPIRLHSETTKYGLTYERSEELRKLAEEE